MGRRWVVLVLVGWFALVGGAARPAWAHGGVVTVDDLYAGCHLVVQATPAPETGQVRFTVVVTTPDSEAPIAAAVVEVEAVPAGGGTALTWPLPAEAGQPGYYDALIALPALGEWQFTVRLRWAGQEGTAPFRLTIQGPPPSIVWIIGLVPGVLGLALVAGLRLHGGTTHGGGAAAGAAPLSSGGPGGAAR